MVVELWNTTNSTFEMGGYDMARANVQHALLGQRQMLSTTGTVGVLDQGDGAMESDEFNIRDE